MGVVLLIAEMGLLVLQLSRVDAKAHVSTAQPPLGAQAAASTTHVAPATASGDAGLRAADAELRAADAVVQALRGSGYGVSQTGPQ